MEGNVENVIRAKYLGGHKVFPNSKNLDVYLAKDYLAMPALGLKVPYKTITNFETGPIENKADLLNKGLAGLVWKKKAAVTLITFTDNTGTVQTMAFDFGNDYNYVDQFVKEKLAKSDNPTK